MSASTLTTFFYHGDHQAPLNHRTSRTSSLASSKYQKPTMSSFLSKFKNKVARQPSNSSMERGDMQQASKGTSQRGFRAPQSNNPFMSNTPATRRPDRPGMNAFTTPSNEPPPPYSAGPSSSDAFSPFPSAAAQEIEDDRYAFLADFDTVFLIDDSGSMAGHRWTQTKAALKSITPICTKHDANGIDIYFLNFRPKDLPPHITSFNRRLDHFENITKEDEVTEIFSLVQPRAATPTGRRLNDILKPYLADLQRGKDLKPMNIIVITDGTPSDDVETILIKTAKTLDKCDAPPRQVGIQFFQVGNDRDAREHLKQLDDGLKEISEDPDLRDIVDTVPFTSENGGELTSKGILKVVLGSVLARLDRDSRELHRT